MAETPISQHGGRPASRQSESTTALELGSPFGITVALDWSLLIIAVLIATTLSVGALPQWHPDWSAPMRWLVGASAAVLLFFSILVHEFSHALVARRFGTPVERITLFLFGGMAHITEEPRTWKAEMLIALAGPVVSVILGILFILPVGLGLEPGTEATPQGIFAGMGPVETLLFWAGNVNIILALFNLVPAYPLDGGRVFRAILWALSGDMRQATARAALLGRLFGWLLIVAGIAMAMGLEVPVFGTGVVGGLWLLFIGWFLSRTALLSMQEATTKQALDQILVRTVMRTEFASIGENVNLEQLVEDYILPRGQRAFPVLRNGSLVGLVSFDDVRRVPRERWSSTTVNEIMTGADRVVTLGADTDATEALAALGRHRVNQIPVLDDRETVVGLLHREDILNWLALYRPGAGDSRPQTE